MNDGVGDLSDIIPVGIFVEVDGEWEWEWGYGLGGRKEMGGGGRRGGRTDRYSVSCLSTWFGFNISTLF